jgi:hypothetical protein
MFCDFENFLSLVDTPQSQFKMSFTRGNVVSLCVILVLHAVQRRKMFRTVISNKWRHLVYQQVCHLVALVCFLQAEFHGYTHGSIVVTLRTYFCCSLFHLLHLLTLFACWLVCTWVFFPIIFQLSCEMPLSGWSQKHHCPVWVKYQFSNIVWL